MRSSPFFFREGHPPPIRQPSSITCTGRVSRVDTKYMYVNCYYGSVFCPIATTVAEECPDLRKKYKEGDIVHLTATLQRRKNHCTYCAVRVRISPNSEQYQGLPLEEELDEQVVEITGVHETMAYGTHEKYGSVFIPGSVFPCTQTGRLNTHISMGDKVEVKMRPQSEKSGCKWLAVTAKILEKKEADVITGRGQLIQIEKYYAVAWNDTFGKVHCPILTWCGGDMDTGNDLLTDLLKYGDDISFNAKKPESSDEFRAIRWVRSNQPLGPSNKITAFADSTTQTLPTVIDLFVRSIPQNKLDELLEDKPMLKELVNQSLEKS